MTEITIDYNNDKVEVRAEEFYHSIPITGQMHQIEKLIFSILNGIDFNKPNPDITLFKEDEDKRTVLGDW